MATPHDDDAPPAHEPDCLPPEPCVCAGLRATADTVTTADLDLGERLDREARPEPWTAGEEDEDGFVIFAGQGRGHGFCEFWNPRRRPDTRFIAAARDLVPALAAERDAAIRERDAALALNNALTEANDGLGRAAYSANARAEKAETEAAAWRIAIMKLTPGGSEYTNPDAVIAFVERERADRHKARAEKAKAVREAAAMRKEVEQLREALSDPIAVHANMLRGAIAMPSVENIIHIYGAEALRAALTSKGGEG